MRLSNSIGLLLSTALASVAISSALDITRAEIDQRAALGDHLISLEPDVDPVWMTEDEVEALIASKANFFDVTDLYDPVAEAALLREAPQASAAYGPPAYQTAVKAITATVSLTNMQNYLNKLTSFNNRYYRADTGQQASIWIRDTIQGIISANPGNGASVALFNHSSWVQSSIVAKIPGQQAGPVTILGAHMDSINGASQMSGRAPGADDDGSGTVNLMEAFRALTVAGFKPTTPVEFHWYAAEEGGLRGSQAIATSYKTAGVQVKGMMQLDMTAYVKPGTSAVVGLMPDYTDPSLTDFVGSLVETYTNRKWTINQPCGYACSDHASWNRQGYAAVLPFESLFSNDNPNIHTSGDTINVNGFSWEHTFEYTKLAVAYAYELGA